MNILVKHESVDKGKPIVLKLMMRGKHLYELNDNLSSLTGKETQNVDVSDKPIIKASNKYKIIEKQPEEETKILFSNTYEHMIKQIKKYTKRKTIKFVKLITSLNLNDVLIDLIKSGYTPKINFNNFIYKISFYIKVEKEHKIISVECCDNNPIYGKLINFDNLEDYTAYTKIYTDTYEKMIKKEFVSDSNEETRRIDDYFIITAPIGYFDNKNIPANRKASIVDENKAYTQRLIELKKIPVFNYFDVYYKYDNHTLEDLTMYTIELLETDESIKCMFDNIINRCDGSTLKN
jgi:hypothetical protein